MQPICYQYLQSHPHIANFVRFNPSWYRYLTRDPNRITELPGAAKKYYGKTFPQQLEKISNQVQMAGMLVQFADAMKD
ncbi:YlbE-like family protein [Lentibacillus sp. Marseille-P4043]|uniref:YlbE-like family protein n=1 Tax=Lentibacillus sp. Marseille-P4043 TaxID=2040293 RepID=UPI000D0B0604|nr:YlbE-like family protein [Lentibacillus sp. Marseille-P4043]